MSSLSANPTVFSPDQHYAFEQFKKGKNLFVTGPGGTGKTHLIKSMVAHLEQKGVKYQVCALTGCAAVLLQCHARTLHSWAGMGLANGSASSVIQKILRNKRATASWRQVQVLIVDEVSMMSKKLFEIIENVGRSIKHKPLFPFGGIQVIFTGDFYQLPPIGTPGDEDSGAFCFESAKWAHTFTSNCHIELRTIFRQNDERYKRILNQIREGSLDEDGAQTLYQHVGREPPDAEHMPTKLYAIRAKADYVNTNMYAKLPINGIENEYMFIRESNLTTYADDGKPIEAEYLQAVAEMSPAEIEMEQEALINNSNRNKLLRLKVGARVMCLHNIDLEHDICNGAQGFVTRFVTDAAGRPIPFVKFTNGVEIPIAYMCTQSELYPPIGVSQIPLTLAWALTIHKIQGATLSIAEMDLGNSVFECGQTYVALSRVKNLDGLYLSAFNPLKIKVNPLVKRFYEKVAQYTATRDQSESEPTPPSTQSQSRIAQHTQIPTPVSAPQSALQRISQQTQSQSQSQSPNVFSSFTNTDTEPEIPAPVQPAQPTTRKFKFPPQ